MSSSASCNLLALLFIRDTIMGYNLPRICGNKFCGWDVNSSSSASCVHSYVILLSNYPIWDIILLRPMVGRKILPIFMVSDVNIMQYTCILLFIRVGIMGYNFALGLRKIWPTFVVSDVKRHHHVWIPTYLNPVDGAINFCGQWCIMSSSANLHPVI